MLRNISMLRVSLTFFLFVWLLAIYAGLIGARLMFLLESNLGAILKEPLQIIVFWQGGLGWYGGIGFGCAAALAGFAIARMPVWLCGGAIASGIALADAVSRIGCFYCGCCYGSPTSLPWGVYNYELQTTVHPTQIYTLLVAAATAAGLQFMWEREHHRIVLLPMYGMMLSGSRFLIEFVRGEPAGPVLVPGLRFYQAVSILFFLASAAMLLYIKRSNAREAPFLHEELQTRTRETNEALSS